MRSTPIILHGLVTNLQLSLLKNDTNPKLWVSYDLIIIRIGVIIIALASFSNSLWFIQNSDFSWSQPFNISSPIGSLCDCCQWIGHSPVHYFMHLTATISTMAEYPPTVAPIGVIDLYNLSNQIRIANETIIISSIISWWFILKHILNHAMWITLFDIFTHNVRILNVWTFEQWIGLTDHDKAFDNVKRVLR